MFEQVFIIGSLLPGIFIQAHLKVAPPRPPPCSHIPSLYHARCIHICAHIHSCIDTCVQASAIDSLPPEQEIQASNVISIEPDINGLSQPTAVAKERRMEVLNATITKPVMSLNRVTHTPSLEIDASVPQGRAHGENFSELASTKSQHTAPVSKKVKWLSKADDISKWFKELRYPRESELNRPNLEGLLVARPGLPLTIMERQALALKTVLAKATPDLRWKGAKLPAVYHDPLDKFHSLKSEKEEEKCCWNRFTQPCKDSSQCDPGGEGCIVNGTMTSKHGR